MRYVNSKVLSGTVSGTTPIVGGKIDSSQIISASFQVAGAAAGVAGTLKVQASNDPNAQGSYNDADFTPSNWSDITSATSTITAGVGAPILLSQMAYRWVRVVFTPSAGSTVVAVNYFGFSV